MTRRKPKSRSDTTKDRPAKGKDTRARSTLTRRLYKGAAGVGLVTIITYLGNAFGLFQSAYVKVFRYPIELTYVSQSESQAGYVFELQIHSPNGDAVFIPRDAFHVMIVRDQQLEARVPPDERQKLLHGETVKVFDNRLVLEAEIAGRTYTSTPTVASVLVPRPLFLLVKVADDGNPSLALQIAPIYRSVAISLDRRGLRQDYLEVPIRRVHIISGNDKTRIIQ